ncbi:hypothetical protein A1O7_06722 [Cladophialophora yegresii CBS 114405]|uniref:Uncharacterized protein n=1 Tax=Cladophialophora yegresii CBS 114405 TaxID=1182544 RepID=W9W2P8_9EURO|nr:uncharacterized protein A1O7_06722 [Cladophialophora yegresii CBS 114405]EXJ59290.1 hypothetical protein A1O7_06722 [Cladophialophora yegresii CBS 114405]
MNEDTQLEEICISLNGMNTNMGGLLRHAGELGYAEDIRPVIGSCPDEFASLRKSVDRLLVTKEAQAESKSLAQKFQDEAQSHLKQLEVNRQASEALRNEHASLRTQMQQESNDHSKALDAIFHSLNCSAQETKRCISSLEPALSEVGTQRTQRILQLISDTVELTPVPVQSDSPPSESLSASLPASLQHFISFFTVLGKTVTETYWLAIECEKELVESQQEKISLHSSLDELKMDHAVMASEKAGLESSFQVLSQEKVDLGASLGSLEKDKANMVEDKARLESSLHALSQEKANMASERIRLEVSLKRLKEERRAAIAESTKLRDSLASLEGKNANLTALKSALEASAAVLAKEKATLISKQVKLEHSLSSWQERKQAEIDLAIRERAQTQQTLDNLCEQHDRLGDSESSLRRDSDQLEKRYEAAVASHNQTRSDLEQRLNGETDAHAMTKADLGANLTRAEHALQTALSQHHQALHLQRKQRDRTILNLRNNLTVSQSTSAMLQRRVRSLRHESHTLERAQRALERDYGTLQREHSILQNTHANLKSVNHTLEDQANEALRDYKEANDALQKSNDRREVLQAELGQCTQQLQSTRDDHDALSSRLEDVVAERNDLDGNITLLLDRVGDQKAEALVLKFQHQCELEQPNEAFERRLASEKEALAEEILAKHGALLDAETQDFVFMIEPIVNMFAQEVRSVMLADKDQEVRQTTGDLLQTLAEGESHIRARIKERYRRIAQQVVKDSIGVVREQHERSTESLRQQLDDAKSEITRLRNPTLFGILVSPRQAFSLQYSQIRTFFKLDPVAPEQHPLAQTLHMAQVRSLHEQEPAVAEPATQQMFSSQASTAFSPQSHPHPAGLAEIGHGDSERADRDILDQGSKRAREESQELGTGDSDYQSPYVGSPGPKRQKLGHQHAPSVIVVESPEHVDANIADVQLDLSFNEMQASDQHDTPASSQEVATLHGEQLLDDHGVARQQPPSQPPRQFASSGSTLWPKGLRLRTLCFLAWDVTEADEQAFQLCCNAIFSEGRSFEDVQKFIDRYCVGPLDAPPPNPPGCLVARFNGKPGGAGNKLMTSRSCKWCQGQKLCLWARFADGVATGFGPRVGRKILDGREHDADAQPRTVEINGQDARWIVKERKSSKEEDNDAPFAAGSLVI